MSDGRETCYAARQRAQESVDRHTTPYSISSTVELSGALSNGSLLKVGDGILTLSGTNSYGGPTVVGSGTLRAMPGVGLPNASNLVLAGGTFETVDATTFARTLGSGTNQVQWTGSGGFAGEIAINLGGAAPPAPVTWGAGGFVPDGSALAFAAAGLSGTDFQNPIDLGGAARTVTVGTNATATLSGVLSNGGLTKSGPGWLIIINNTNTFAGTVAVAEGTLEVQNAKALGSTAGSTVVAKGA
jgi:autotransporter-associated beta strand protein